MNELREQAMKHILRIEKLKEQHAELEDFQESIRKSNAGLPGYLDVFDDIGICINTLGGWHRVNLKQDLGITTLTAEFKEKLFAATEVRKADIESELKKLIGGNGESE